MPKVATQARFEPGTMTIRSVPENYWLASMDSWDGAVDHIAMAQVFAAAPAMLAALTDLRDRLAGFIGADCECDNTHAANNTQCCLCEAAAVIAAATGD